MPAKKSRKKKLNSVGLAVPLQDDGSISLLAVAGLFQELLESYGIAAGVKVELTKHAQTNKPYLKATVFPNPPA